MSKKKVVFDAYALLNSPEMSAYLDKQEAEQAEQKKRLVAEQEAKQRKTGSQQSRSVSDDELSPEALKRDNIRQTTDDISGRANDVWQSLKSGAATLIQGAGWLANEAGAHDSGQFLRDIGQIGEDQALANLTPAGRKAQKNGVFKEDLSGVNDDWGRGMAQGIAGSAVPSIVGAMLGAPIARGTGAAGEALLGRAAVSEGALGSVLDAAIKYTPAPVMRLAGALPGAAGAGAGEAAVTGATNGAQAYQEVMDAPIESLRKSPAFQSLSKELGSEDAARKAIADRMSIQTAKDTALSTGLIGAAMGGGAVGSLLNKFAVKQGAKEVGRLGAKAATKEVLKDGAKEFAEEFAQSGPEHYLQNAAKRDYLDPTIDPSTGMLRASLEGGVIGMGQGMGMSGGAHAVNRLLARNEPQPSQPANTPQQQPNTQPSSTPKSVAGYDPIAPNQADLLRRMGVEADPVADAAAASVESVLGAGDPTAGLVASVMRGEALQPIRDMAAVRANTVLPVGSNEGGLYEPQWLPDAASGESSSGMRMPRRGFDSQEQMLANAGMDARDVQRKADIASQVDAAWAQQQNPVQKARELESLAQESAVPVAIDRAEQSNQINQVLANAAGEGVAVPNAMQLALQRAQNQGAAAKPEENTQKTAKSFITDGASDVVAPQTSTSQHGIAHAITEPDQADTAPNISDKAPSIPAPAPNISSEPALTMQQTERGQWLIKGDMAQHAGAIRDALKGMNVLVSPKKGQALVAMPKDKDTSKQAKAIRKALDHLLLNGEQLAQRDAQRAQAGERMQARNKQALQVDHANDDILQAIAKMGGIDTEQALSEWWRGQSETVGHYNAEVPGNLRRQGAFAFKRGGQPIDTVIRRLEGEGYLPEGATPNDLLDAIEQRRLHPAGMEEQARREFEARQQEEQANAPGEFQQAYDDGRFADEFTATELEDDGFFDLNRRAREAAEAAAEAAAIAKYEQENAEWDALLSQPGKSYEGMSTEDILNEIFGPETTTSQDSQGESTTRQADASRTRAGIESGREDGGQGSTETQGSSDGFSLAVYTESDIQRQEREAEQRRVDDERQRAAADKARQDEETRKEIRRRSEAAADTFVLGGNAEDNLTGQGGLFDAPAETSSTQTPAHSPEKAPDMAPNAASSAEMDSLKAEMGDAIGELASLLGVRKNLTAEEEAKIIPVMAKIFRIAAKMGYIQFKEAGRYVIQQIRQIGGDELANKLSIDNLQAGYINIAKEIGGDKREALAYESIHELEGEPQQGANESQSDNSESATDTTAPSLVDKFAGEIANGNMPKDNNALRKMVAVIDGKQPDAFRMKQAQEDLEAAIVVAARSKVAEGGSTRDTFNRLVDLYQSQPNLNIRTSTSIANQAYSTPAPLAYVAAKLADITSSTHVFEPTAGNGMLLLTAEPHNATANELDDQRFANLQAQGFDAMQGNALEAVTSGAVAEKSQDAVITNPPFGSVKDDAGKATKVNVDGYKIGKIDHLIAADALRTMKDDGKAVLIIGADKVAGGLSTDDRIFFNWLYSHYNVTHHFEVDGSLYSRQGASWPVRVIALNGRVESNGISPKAGTVERVSTWEQVYGQLEQGLVSQDRRIDRNAASSADGSVPGTTAANEQVDPPVVAGGKTQQRNNVGRTRGTAGAADVGGRGAGAGRNTEQLPAEGMGAADSAQRRNESATGQIGLESGNPERVQASATAGSDQPSGNSGANRVTTLADAENAYQARYVPASSRKDDGVLIPVNMAQPLSDALAAMEDETGNIDQFAAKELGYRSVGELHQALMGLQVDSVATAVRNLKNGNGTIIADQTGIGKGRQAAAIIRWAVKNGRIPVFVTVKPALFTDMYNDLADIGSHDIAPFILNVDESISGASGNKLFANKKATHKQNLNAIANSGTLPDDTNAVFMTYSQINTANIQRSAIAAIAPRAIFVLDESHNAGGESATGEYIKGLLDTAPGVVYLSATYAKRPDNMPLYFRTDIGKAIADDSALKDAMANGGLPLQTVVSNNLVKAGQMFRRERSYDGISISTVVDSANKERHVELADKVTSALRAIVSADKAFHENYFEAVKKALEKEGKDAYDNAGNQAGKSVDHSEFSSVVHNFVRQLLLGLKADAAADHAIAALKRGEKPLIALENTMGSFLSEYAAGAGIQVGKPLGDFDYRTVLSRALKRSRYIQVDDGKGNKSKQYIGLEKLDPVTRLEYDNAQEVIDSLDVADIPVSPLDWIRYRLQKAGYSVAEITGRDLAVDYSKATPVLANVPSEEQSDKVLTTRRFNSGKLDAIILNVSGSTGISLHASEKFSDKRPRHMIVAQPAQDINIFMQMLGRIHRTGQVVLPNYTILNVDLPAEKRPTALLSKKMKSLNANTSSNTESATSVQSVDILNKYGDQVVADYLQENIDLAQAMNIEVSADAAEDIARRVTGRLALMPVETQHRFYSEVEEQYQSLIDYLNKTNQNDLEPRTFDFDAKETRRETLVKASGESPFEQAADYIEFSIKAQGKAMTPDEIKAEISDNLQGKQPSEHAADMVASLNEKYQAFVAEQQSDSAREKAAGAKMAGERFILQHPIGSTWRVEINDDHYNAVIINIKNSHKSAGNPFSLSKTTVTIAVNGSLRQVSVPATQFEKITTSQIYSYGPYQASVDRYFSSRVADERETAKMITGNLLAAYGELSGVHGTIVNFSRADGSVDQGILLPKRFDFKQNTSGDYRFKSGSDAYKFLRESNSKGVDKIGVQNREQTVRVTLDSNGIAISVPKSKAKGGKYFGDTALTKITGDFVSAGGMMNAYVDKQNAEAAIDTLIKKTALYAIPSMAEEARKIVGDEMPEPTASVESTGNKLNSKANDHTQGMSAKDLQAIIAKALPAHLRERVKVAQSRSNNAQQSARSEDRDLIEAEYDPATGQLTLYADAIPTPERALFVLAHELTHYGLDKKYGFGLSSILLETRNNPMIAKLANAIAADRGMTVNSVRQDIADALGISAMKVARSIAIHRLQTETANEALAELNAAIERNDFAYLQDRYGVTVPKMMRNDLRGRLARLTASVKAWLAKLTGKQSTEYSDKQVWDLLAGVRDVVRGGGKSSAGYSDGAAQHSMAASSKTINIDGVTRPTTNSNGKPIAQTEEGLRNFWRWFGDSKVVDKDGKPLVVYHGTESDFDSFDQNKVKTTKLGSGFYFAKDPETANLYAGFSGSNVVPVYLRMERPLIASSVEEARQILEDNGQYMNIDEFSGTHAADMADVLAKAGFDGIMYDGVMVVQNPTQIKSAVGNQGTFNGSDPNILRSTAPKQPASAGFSLPDETLADTAQREVQDNMNRWRQVLENVREQGGQVDEQNDVYGAEERFHGRAATRIEDFARDEVEPLMQRLADSGHSLQDVEQYLLAQHAEEANARIREIDDSRDTAFGMEDGEAQSILAKFAAMPDAAEFKRLANDFRRISEGTLSLYVKAGIVSPDAAHAMRMAYQFYVPVKGGDEDQAARQGTGKGLSVNGKQKRRMGHDMRDEHVLENMLRDRQRAIILAEKNNVGTYLLDLIERNPDPKLWTVGVLPKQKVLRDQVSYVVELNGQMLDAFNSMEAARVFIQAEAARTGSKPGAFAVSKSSDPYVSMMAKPTLQDHEVQVYVQGRAVRIQLHDPILAGQYRRMGAEQMGRIIEAGKSLNRWLSKVYTGYNPEFFIKNVVRDLFAGTINLTADQGAKVTARALWHWPKAGAAMFKFALTGKAPSGDYGKALQRYRAAGGSTGAAYMGDLERQANTLTELYENYTGAMATLQQGKPFKAARIAGRKLVQGLAHWFEVWNQAGESAFRLATFMAMQESGKTVAESASMAKNVTVNFNRKGELTPQLGALYLFFNPSVQGSQRLWQSLFGGDTKHKAQAWALVGSMAGAALALAMMNRGDDEDEWEAMPDSVKDRNLIIPLGNGRKLTIPLPYGYSFFASMANRLDAVMHGESAEKASIRLASAVFENFSPVGNPIGDDPKSGNWLLLLPTAIKIPALPAANLTDFGGPMRPDEAKDDMPDNLKMYRGTRGSIYDKAAQGFSRGFEAIGIGSPYENNWNDISPETIKYLFKTLAGGTGGFMADSASLLNVLASGSAPDVSEVPFLRSAVRESTVKDARARFYDLGKDAKGHVEAWNRAVEAGDDKAAGEYERDGELLALGQMMDGYRKQATAMRDLMTQEMQREDLTLAEKRLKQKSYESQEAEIYRDFIKQFRH